MSWLFFMDESGHDHRNMPYEVRGGIALHAGKLWPFIKANYFQRTNTGRYRTARIIPVPFFVASDMSIPVQAADLCIYAVNWGFRLPTLGMTATERLDIKNMTGDWISRLQYHGEGYRDGSTFKTHGIVYVPDPYESRE